MALCDVLSTQEYDWSVKSLEVLRTVPWAVPLVKRMTMKDGSFNKEDLPGMFELRFAHALHCKGITDVQYECNTIDETSVDFSFCYGNRLWLLELVSSGVSKAVRAATGQDEKYPSVTITALQSSKAMNAKEKGLQDGLSPAEIEKLVKEAAKESEEGELLLLQQKIGEKVYRNSKIVKFPAVRDSSAVHVIVVDTRGFMGSGGMDLDYLEACVGIAAYNNQTPKFVHVWEGAPIKGLFESDNTKSGAQHIRERIHLIHFVNEEREDYCQDGIDRATELLYPSPTIFNSEEERIATHTAYPFHRASSN